MRIIDTVSAFAARVTRWIVIVAAAVMIASLILQIFFRYVIGSSLVWSEELALFLFTWVVLLAGSLGVRERYHVRLTLFCDMLPGHGRRILDLVIHLISGTFGGLMLVSGYRYLDSTLGQVSAAVRYPIEYLHLAAPVCGALIVLHTLAHLAAMVSPADGGTRHE